MVKVSGCWAGLPQACWEAMTLIKRRVWVAVESFSEPRDCVTWKMKKTGKLGEPGEWGWRVETENPQPEWSPAVLPQLTSGRLPASVISIRGGRKTSLERFGTRWGEGMGRGWFWWGFPRCSAFPWICPYHHDNWGQQGFRDSLTPGRKKKENRTNHLHFAHNPVCKSSSCREQTWWNLLYCLAQDGDLDLIRKSRTADDEVQFNITQSNTLTRCSLNVLTRCCLIPNVVSQTT